MYHDTHPKIILLNIDHTLNGMERIKNWFVNEQFPSNDILARDICAELNNPVVIKYTGKGISIHSNALEREENPNTGSIRDTFNWLSKNGGHLRFPNIIVIASGMADRGINFSDYESGYHITHQVLVKSSKSTCANVIQSCRILGIYNDSMPLKLYTTAHTKEQIIKGNSLSEDVLEQLDETKLPEEYVNKVCKEEVVIHEDNIPCNFLARKNVRKSFKEIVETLVVAESEFVDTDQMQQYLLTNNSKCAQFLRMCNPYLEYSKNQILSMLRDVGYKQPSSMFSAITNPRTRYAKCYFQRVSQDRWKIRSEMSYCWNVL